MKTIPNMLLQLIFSIVAFILTTHSTASIFALSILKLRHVTCKVRSTGQNTVALHTSWTAIIRIHVGAGNRRCESIAWSRSIAECRRAMFGIWSDRISLAIGAKPKVLGPASRWIDRGGAKARLVECMIVKAVSRARSMVAKGVESPWSPRALVAPRLPMVQTARKMA